jgi:hypothetical protein
MGGKMMFSRIRRRLTYANVAMTLALVFAMSGGAFAAGKYLITSTKQISPKVLASLKGAKGASGASGAAGPVGPAGPGGPQGPKGETGTAGTNGTNGEPGKEGKEGKEGPPGVIQPGETLPAKATETGAWVISAGKEPEGLLVAISFPIPLKQELTEQHVFYVEEGGNGTTCPGTSQEPKATAGNLCVYQNRTLSGVNEVAPDLAKVVITSPGVVPSEQGSGTTGAMLTFTKFVETGTPKMPSGFGTWAVTGS